MADTVLGDSSSGSVVLVGGSVTGTIDFTGDQDWYRVSLIAGRQYRFDLLAAPSALGTLDDPYLRLIDVSGTGVLAYNDDAGGTLESSITYTATATGTYFLSAEGFSTRAGTFTLVASDITGGAAGDV